MKEAERTTGMAEVFMIGELASRSARSVHAIRWYETQGLMPGVQRNGIGRRLYSEQHVDWLALMERLRRTGMSIAEMRRYTALVKQGKATLAQRRDMLAAHRARVLATIDEWQRALVLLDSKLDFYGEWLASGHRPAVPPAARAQAAATARPRARRRTP
jgi:DNA-binding transcriptional MerR regulator